MSQWNIITYDVWGNDEDGYEVNDSHQSGIIHLEGDDCYDAAIILQKLQEASYFNDDVEVQHLSWDADDGIVYINDAVDGKPICCIQRDQRW